MEDENTSRLFKVLLWTMSLYGVMGWQIVLIMFDSPALAILIFVGLAVWTVVEYVNTKLVSDGDVDPGSLHATAYKDEAEQIRDKYERHLKFLEHLFIIVARLAKADGRVDESEVGVSMRLFEIYQIPPEAHYRLKQAFNDAVSKCGGSTVAYHAQCVAGYVLDDAAKCFLYEFLWDVACADGVLAEAEKEILKDICQWLQISSGYFDAEYARRRRTFVDEEVEERERKEKEYDSEGRNERSTNDVNASSADDYSLIGVSRDASDDEVRSAYRKMAKSYHPDVLRANNVPEDLIAVANEKMVRLNDAWARIQKARGI